jgi:F-type H+-transporting ATPase subunit epsilon
MFTLELVTLNGLKFSGDVYRVDLPTPDGIIGIYPEHMPLVSMAAPGVISILKRQGDKEEDMEHFATNGGVVEISEHRVRVLVNEADQSSEISEKEAAEAIERARELEKSAKDRVSIDKARQVIQTQQARLRVAELKNRRRKR